MAQEETKALLNKLVKKFEGYENEVFKDGAPIKNDKTTEPECKNTTKHIQI